MGLSETIIAAIIGAGATMATAIFQLLRNRAPIDVRPRKNRIRSLFATVALMIGCIVGGYAWSSLRAVSANEQMRSALQSEFTRQFAALAADKPDATDPPSDSANGGEALPAGHTRSGSADSLVKLPPCTLAEPGGEAAVATCTEREARPVTVCVAHPAAAQGARMQVLARAQKPDSPWQRGEARTSTIGDLHVDEAPSEPLPGDLERSACLTIANWSTEETLLVRLLVDYSPPAPTDPPVAPITASLQ